MYYDQLRSYMHFSQTATPWLHLSGYNPLACLPSGPGSGGQQLASYTRMQRPRKHQPLPYRTGLDPRPLLAAVVCLPQERGEEPKPFYQEAEIQAAFLSASPAGIDQETYGDRHPPNQYPMAEDRSSEAILNGVYPCASPLSTTNDSDLDSDQAGGLNSSLADSEPVLPPSASEGLPANSSSPEIPPPIHSSVPAAAGDPSVGLHASPDLGPSAPSGDEPCDTGAVISSVERTEGGDGEDDVSTPEPKSSKKHLSRTEGIGSEEMPNLVQ